MKDLAIKSHLQKDKFIKELYAINLPRFEKQISASYINARKLECKIIENGIILPLRKFHHSSHNDVFEGGVTALRTSVPLSSATTPNGAPA